MVSTLITCSQNCDKPPSWTFSNVPAFCRIFIDVATAFCRGWPKYTSAARWGHETSCKNGMHGDLLVYVSCYLKKKKLVLLFLLLFLFRNIGSKTAMRQVCTCPTRSGAFLRRHLYSDNRHGLCVFACLICVYQVNTTLIVVFTFCFCVMYCRFWRAILISLHVSGQLGCIPPPSPSKRQ